MEDKNKKADSVIIEVKGTSIDNTEDKKDSNNTEDIENNKDNNKTDDNKNEENKDEEEQYDNIDNIDDDKEEDATVTKTSDLLSKFKDYICSNKFDDKCENAAEKTGIKQEVIKNTFIKNTLGTIANALNLVVSISGDILTGCIKFIENVLCNIVNFSQSVLHKIITMVTFNCGTVEY